MVYLRLMGGLGNQMSQVAYAYIIAEQNHENLLIDTSSYKRNKLRKCSIFKFELDHKVFQFESDTNYAFCRLFQIIYHIYVRIFYPKKQVGRNTFEKLALKGHYYSFDSDYYGFPKSLKKNKDVYGYFLSYDCFYPYKNEIKRLFTVKDLFIDDNVKEYLSVIKKHDCVVSVSLRLQDDYINNKETNVCSKEYFRKAFDYFTTNNSDIFFLVFADDINRAKEFLNSLEVQYVEKCSDVQQLFLMWNCNHYIISNSSFSWWGAFLSNNDTAQIVAPNRWMNNEIDYHTKYFDGMVKIDV